MSETQHINAQQFGATVQVEAVTHIGKALDAHKQQRGLDRFDEAVVGNALMHFAALLKKYNFLAAGPEADQFVKLTTAAIARGAAEARRRAEDKRIITLR